MQRMSRSQGAMGVLLALLIAGCAIATAPPVAQLTPTPSPAPSTTTPEATEAGSAAGGKITGTATYGGEPLPGAMVELRAPGWQTNLDPAVASAEADAQGQFVLENVPAGDYSLIGIFPDGEEDAGGWPPVTIAASETIIGLTVPLERGLELLEPAKSQVEASPTLRWESFPEAAEYRVLVIDAGTTELAVEHVTPDTSLTVTPPLKPGRTYDWVVNALAENDMLVATGSSQFTVEGTTEEAATPADPDTAGLPPSCQTGSDQLAVYVDRAAGYCLLYAGRCPACPRARQSSCPRPMTFAIPPWYARPSHWHPDTSAPGHKRSSRCCRQQHISTECKDEKDHSQDSRLSDVLPRTTRRL